MMSEATQLAERLGLTFRDESLLLRALTHRSYVNENPAEALEDNERLEFLGDAVLDFLVGAYLFKQYSDMDEGGLTSLRAALVREKTLAQFARQWHIGQHLRLGHGEAQNNGRERRPILCAAFEAVVGAIYLDQGLETARMLVERLIAQALGPIMAESLHKDARSEFQVWAQARYNITPHYEVIDSQGPDHARVFTMQVMVSEEVWGTGVGRSKQAAAQAAAREALDKVEAQE